jgi:hypothetical protein
LSHYVRALWFVTDVCAVTAPLLTLISIHYSFGITVFRVRLLLSHCYEEHLEKSSDSVLTMILVDDKQNEVLEARRLAEEQANVSVFDHFPLSVLICWQSEPPPTYSSIQHSPLASEQSLQLSTRANPTNFFSVARSHDQVKETVTIDPNLYIPPSLLPPLCPDETEGTRKHVRIESSHGSVNATVNIVPALGAQKDKIRMFMRSVHGGVFARIVSTCLRDSMVNLTDMLCDSEWPRLTPFVPPGG